jgi:hypothetical protein
LRQQMRHCVNDLISCVNFSSRTVLQSRHLDFAGFNQRL